MKNLLLLTATVFLFACNSTNREIAQWRGVNRDGIFNETNLSKEWPKDGPQLLWVADSTGNGYGSPTISGDKIYLNGETDSIAYLFAFNLKGELLWKSSFGKDWTENFQGSRSTPTVIDKHVYVCSSLGDVACFNATSGEKIWSKNFLKDFHGQITRFGYTESLLVEGNTVYCTPGGKDTNIVALDRFTGNAIWISKGDGARPNYSSPAIVNLLNKKILVTFSEKALVGIDLSNGNLLWSHIQDTLCDIHGNTPLIDKNSIYYTTGCGNGTVKLKLSSDGSSINEEWRTFKLDNTQGGLVIHNNMIIGTSHRKPKLLRVDLNSGGITDSLNTGRGSVVFSDGMIYFYSEKGVVNLIKPEPKLELISSFKIEKGTKEHFAHPVIHNGVLYIRHGKALMAFNIKGK